MAETRNNRSKRRSLLAYSRWDAMKQRCLNKNSNGYKWYGARGITVCDRWLKFDNFFEDMGEPDAGMTLERINNDEGYSPENCIWADYKTQANNNRGNHRLTFKGKTKTLEQWAEEKGLKANTILTRIKRGWSLEESLNTKTTERKKSILRENKSIKDSRKRKCLFCKKIFYPRQYQLDHGKGKYCSISCSSSHLHEQGKIGNRKRYVLNTESLSISINNDQHVPPAGRVHETLRG